jgi:molybdate transport system substrate-binding protein
VVLSFGSSSALAQQLRQGAPADVFAAADRRTMGMVTGAGLAPAGPPVFARNRLQIAVPAGNPGRVRGLPDLARAELAVALCAPSVPCGAAARDALRAAGISARPDTYEKDVKAALAKVVLGEVDAALVYRTDVLAAGDKVIGIALPGAAGAVNDYPVTVLDAAANPEAARAFVAHLRSPAGRRTLSEAGFQTP